jgi:hypothetical protein
VLNDKFGRSTLKRIELKTDCDKRIEQCERHAKKIIIVCLGLGWCLGYYTYNLLWASSGGGLL